jgi:hypothetical protein
MENENTLPSSITYGGEVYVPQDKKHVVSEYLKRAKLVRTIQSFLNESKVNSDDTVEVTSWIIDMSQAGIDRLAADIPKHGIIKAAEIRGATDQLMKILKA